MSKKVGCARRQDVQYDEGEREEGGMEQNIARGRKGFIQFSMLESEGVLQVHLVCSGGGGADVSVEFRKHDI